MSTKDFGGAQHFVSLGFVAQIEGFFLGVGTNQNCINLSEISFGLIPPLKTTLKASCACSLDGFCIDKTKKAFTDVQHQ